ncbi:MAG: DUF819 domain-containing protein [Phycisphaerales bacterium JB038]
MILLADDLTPILQKLRPDLFPIEHPMGILAVLLAVLAVIFWFGDRTLGKKVFGIVPKLVFCYFVPTTLTTLGVLPAESELYVWIKVFMLPASLLLLVLALDVPGILRLGPKAGIMLLAGTAGGVIGAPLAYLISAAIFGVSDTAAADVGQAGITASTLWTLPADTWQGMTSMSGSWIGGGANMVALQQICECSDEMFSLMVIVDVFVANIWMGVLLYGAGVQNKIDRWTGANTAAIEDLKRRIAAYEEKVTRVPTLTDLIIIVAFGFVVAWICYVGGNWLAETLATVDQKATAAERLLNPEAGEVMKPILSATTWKFILITTIGVVLSFTRARNLEGAGASKVGSVFLYILVASIGAHASFLSMAQAPALVVMGFIWMAFHIVVLLVVGYVIKAPIFFVAVGSQANIGGAASAPIVASAFHPTLAPVGVLLAVAGYVLGTYAGLLIMVLLKLVAGA